jgi:hypothetical protein
VRVDDLPDLGQFLVARGLRGQGAEHEARSRPAEGAGKEVRGELLLRALLGNGRLVEVRPEAFAARHQSLLVHELHLLQRGGVAASLVEGLVNFADRAGPALPQDGEDVELGSGREQHAAFVVG